MGKPVGWLEGHAARRGRWMQRQAPRTHTARLRGGRPEAATPPCTPPPPGAAATAGRQAAAPACWPAPARREGWREASVATGCAGWQAGRQPVVEEKGWQEQVTPSHAAIDCQLPPGSCWPAAGHLQAEPVSVHALKVCGVAGRLPAALVRREGRGAAVRQAQQVGRDEPAGLRQGGGADGRGGGRRRRAAAARFAARQGRQRRGQLRHPCSPAHG